MSYTKIMPRGGTKYEWTTMNPVLAEREMAVEYPDSGIGTGLCRFKFGDGFKTYNELAYAFDGASASSMIGGSAFAGNTFQIRADTHENWLLANPVLEENELVYDTTYNCFYIGDGASRFNQLTPAGRDAQRIYDFGDEDEDEIVSPVTSATGGVSTVSAMSAAVPPVATLGDLMSMAFGSGIDPQPIEGGAPFIIEPLSEPAPKINPVEDVMTASSIGDDVDFKEEESLEDGNTITTVDEFLDKNSDIVEEIDDIQEDDSTPTVEEGENTESEATE